MDRSASFVRWTLRQGRSLLLVTMALFTLGAWQTAKLYGHLRSDLDALLPKDATSVRALEELRHRLDTGQTLGIIAETGPETSPRRAEEFLDRLAQRLRTYPPDLVARVRSGTEEEQAYLEAHAPLYLSLDDLQQLERRIEEHRDRIVSKEIGTQLDEAPVPPLDLSDFEARLRSQAGVPDVASRWTHPKLGASVLLVTAPGFSTGGGHLQELLRRVRGDVDELRKEPVFQQGLSVGLAGELAISEEELSALVEDVSVTTVAVVLLVGASIVLYFRWFSSLIALFVPLATGTVMAFSIATLPPFEIAELNSNTAFLGSIIVGNGINFGIVLLAFFVRGKRAGATTEDALIKASSRALRGTLAAAAAASISYASLSATQFQGFHQFGVIGGLGMITCWVATFTLTPPLIVWLDKHGLVPRSEPATPERPPRRVFSVTRPMAAAVTALGVLATLASLTRLPGFLERQLESDFSKLRRRDTWVSGEGYWGRKMDAVLGRYLSPIVFLCDSSTSAENLALALKAQSKTLPFQEWVADIRSVEDVIPSQQSAKFEVLEKIQDTLTPRIVAHLPKAQQPWLDRVASPTVLEKVSVDTLPAPLAAPFVESSGEIGRTVLVFPKVTSALWQGSSLEQFVLALRAVGNEVSGPGTHMASSLALSADILTQVKRDGPLASAMALAGVVLIVVVTFGLRKESLLVLASLHVGILWLVGLSVLFGIKINFANFIVFPITFGIGVDYAVNLMSAATVPSQAQDEHLVQQVSGAVALCSWTTVVGYASLVFARNNALHLFGCLAVLGEAVCLAAALVFLPSVLRLRKRPSTWHPTGA